MKETADGWKLEGLTVTQTHVYERWVRETAKAAVKAAKVKSTKAAKAKSTKAAKAKSAKAAKKSAKGKTETSRGLKGRKAVKGGGRK